MDLMQLIHCYDGCKKLQLEKASKNLEKLITKVTAKLSKDLKSNENKGSIEVKDN